MPSTRAVKRNPESLRYRNELANAYLEGGHFNLARQQYRSIKETAPQTPLVNYHLGKALERLGRKAEAVQVYRQELRQNNKSWQSAVDCARCYESLGGEENLLLAASFLEQAYQLNPRSHEALFSFQSVYRKLGNKEASENYRKLYAKHYAFKREREADLRKFKDRIQRDPRDFEAWLGMINLRVRFNSTEDVLTNVRNMLLVDANHMSALWHLSNLFLVQG